MRAFAPQALFDFTCGVLGALDGPAGAKPGVHEHELQITINVQQRPRAQPVEEDSAIRREQHFAQFRIDLGLIGFAALGNREQGQIVIAKHADRTLAERLHQSQHRQRLAAAIDQVATKPQRVASAIEIQFFQKAAKFIVATLDIADGVRSH